MNGSRLSNDDRNRIRTRLAAGETVGTVARALGRHRQTVSRVKEELDRQDGTRLAVKLNFRVTEAEHAHLLAAIRSGTPLGSEEEKGRGFSTGWKSRERLSAPVGSSVR